MKVDDLYLAIGDANANYLAESESEASKKQNWLKYGAVAACLCIVLLGSFFSMPNPANAFLVKTYALEVTDDGTIGLTETDLLDQPDVWGGHFDGENFFLNVGLRYEGSNIESVDFIAEEGFFAKQYIGDLSVGDNVSRVYVGAENRLVVYGDEFEISGNVLTLNEETMTDGLLLFWGTQVSDMREVPKHIEIRAVAKFNDGRTQEIVLPVDISGTGVAVGYFVSEEERQQRLEEFDYYKNLPLEQCELVEESIETVTDVYEVALASSTSWITIRGDMPFDENGIFRGGLLGEPTIDGSELYIPVIKRDAEGVYTGMLYRVPKDLHYK